jgi:hypothetical protein
LAANRLAGETSPYLFARRFDPVDWYPWGEEALARSRAENKPIFLSVGYSTCYYCHVMARESFADGGVGRFMNEHFVNDRVDREERPDVDEIYMAATRLLTHRGGWPNTAVLTPDLAPWFCGTYFPPDDRGEQPSFSRMATSMAEAWRSRRGDVEEQAADLVRAMRDYLEDRGETAAAPPAPAAADRALASLAAVYDREWGGFGAAPKFPLPANLLFLEDFAGDDPDAARMLAHTLAKMTSGGIYDQLAGGFHRYAVDREWRVPHFEMLLSDNGLLLEICARELERSGDRRLERVVQETAAFLDRELGLDGGAFATALSAGREGHEGSYHVWTLDELTAVLGAEDAGFLAPILGYDGPPFFEGSGYVLHRPLPIEEHARRRRLASEELEAEIARLEAKLFEARRRRRRPEVDDKVLADWNGMAVAGLAEAGRVTYDSMILERAARCADFILANLRPEGGPLRHCWRGGTAKHDAFLTDYVWLTRGLLALHRATGDEGRLAAARDLTSEQVERLGDPRGGFFTAAETPELLFRVRDVFDGAMPAANAVAVLNLLELAERDGDSRWRELASAALRAFAGVAERGEGVRMLCLAARRYSRPSAGSTLGSGSLPLRVDPPL